MSTESLAAELQFVRRLISQGRLADAISHCTALTRANPNCAAPWGLAAELAVRSNNFTEAEKFLQRAIKITPADPEILIQYGQLLLRLGRRKDALRIAYLADDASPTRAPLQDALGTLLTHLEEPTRAVALFQQAVTQVPTNAGFRYNLAMAQRMVGEFAAAETNLDEVIRTRPDDTEAHYARSDLRKQTPGRNHVPQLENALHRLKGQRKSIPAAYALAKELEDLGEYSRSFEQLDNASRSYRASLRYSVAEDVAVLSKLRAAHTQPILERLRARYENEECIFIVGLPRSGTTLVEQILGSHSAVYAAGELDVFPRVIIESVARRGHPRVQKLDFVDRALEVDMNSIGATYINATRPRTGHRPKFTDKLPSNYLYAGLIYASLPRARFIALRRHPMDNCYAMYRTLFAGAYPFTYDLQDLAQYYVAWKQLMEHWEAVIGDTWLTVHYENLISDQEAVSRKILAHCGLSWEPQCLEFNRRSGAVTTASSVQVRRPLNSHSVGKWHHYAEQLEPLVRHFEANGIVVR